MSALPLPLNDAATTLVIEASDARAQDDRSVGGKAAGLARLEASGAAVPPWFTLTTGAFTLAIAPVRPELDALLAQIASNNGITEDDMRRSHRLKYLE